MRKQLILTFSAIFVVTILTVGFSSKASDTPAFEQNFGEASAFRATENLVPAQETASLDDTTSSSLGEGVVAVEIEEGRSAFFKGLSVTLIAAQKGDSCLTDCLEVTLQLSVGGGTLETVSYEEGDTFLYEGYQIKVSQVAPKEVPSGVSRRAVLLLSVAQ